MIIILIARTVVSMRVGADDHCKDHIVYKMFGQIVYTSHKILAAVDSLGYNELFIHINLGNDKIPVAYSNGLFV